MCDPYTESVLSKRRPAALQGEYDVLIVGGGITGAGVARDAARRGLKTLLVEQSDIASGTSSRSSKLVHGGLRYLEQGELSLVFEAVAERRVLMDIAPHLVHPMPFLLPVFEDSRRGMFTINIGMWLYDGLSLFRSPKLHKSLTRRKVKSVEPALRTKGLKGAQLYYDCSTDDARLTLETAIDAEIQGADIRTYTRLEEFCFEGDKVCGAVLVNVLTGQTDTVRASVIINATGPWSDKTRGQPVDRGAERMRPTKGVHIVVNASRLKIEHAVCCMHPRDGRVFFTIPWGEQTYIGTTDTDFEGDPADVYADAEDIAYLLEATESYFPECKLVEDDVISTWAGVRPLVADAEANDESSVSREHVLVVERGGVLTIAGGKLTTYRRMAEEVVDKAVELLDDTGFDGRYLTEPETEQNPLVGAVGWPEQGGHEVVAEAVVRRANGLITAQSARLLADTLGIRSLDLADKVVAEPVLAEPLVQGRHEIMAQVDWAIDRELAQTVMDVMMRRTQLYYRDPEQGLSAVHAIADRMAKRLGWSEDERVRHIEAYKEEVERSRRWQND